MMGGSGSCHRINSLNSDLDPRQRDLIPRRRDLNPRLNPHRRGFKPHGRDMNPRRRDSHQPRSGLKSNLRGLLVVIAHLVLRFHVDLT